MGLSMETGTILVVILIVAPSLPDMTVIQAPKEDHVLAPHLDETTIVHLVMSIMVAKTTQVQRVERAQKICLRRIHPAMMILVHLRGPGLIAMVMRRQTVRVNGSETRCEHQPRIPNPSTRTMAA